MIVSQLVLPLLEWDLILIVRQECTPLYPALHLGPALP